MGKVKLGACSKDSSAGADSVWALSLRADGTAEGTAGGEAVDSGAGVVVGFGEGRGGLSTGAVEAEAGAGSGTTVLPAA